LQTVHRRVMNAMRISSVLIFFHFIAICTAFDRMFLSVCKAVFSTLKTDFNYISLRPTGPSISSGPSESSISSGPSESSISSGPSESSISSGPPRPHNASLIIFKGSHIRSENYLGISHAVRRIGSERNLNIDIKILRHPFVNIEDTRSLFALGHSSGVYDFLRFQNVTKYDGLMQVGSVLNSKGRLPWNSRDLQTFPIPVLTLLGKKDGYIRHTYCLDEMYMQSDTEKYITKPIIIMKDVNHLHISNSSSSYFAKLLGLSDIKSDIDNKIACDMIGLCIVDFMSLNMNISSSKSLGNSLHRMMQLQNETRLLLTTYLKFDNYANVKTLLHVFQMYMNNATDFTKDDIVFTKYYDFLLSKPSKNIMYCYRPINSYMFAKMYFAPLWCKTKYKHYMTAQRMNEIQYKEIAKCLNLTTTKTVIFEVDKKCTTTMEWIMTDVKIKSEGNITYIRSPIFITCEGPLFKNFYYFKILSPAQIIELLNIDLVD
jgi:hypothetical protein